MSCVSPINSLSLASLLYPRTEGILSNSPIKSEILIISARIPKEILEFVNHHIARDVLVVDFEHWHPVHPVHPVFLELLFLDQYYTRLSTIATDLWQNVESKEITTVHEM